MFLWPLLALRNRDGPEPVSWTKLQEQWRLSSNELYSLVPLLIAAGILAAIVFLIRSGWPQRIWHGCSHTVQALLHVVQPSDLAANDKWMLLRVARHAKLPHPSVLMISPQTFDHHTQAYVRSVKPHRDRKVRAHIDKIRGVAFGVSPGRRPPVILRMMTEHRENLAKKLVAVGARHVRDVVRVTTYYRNPNHDRHVSGGAELCLTLEQELDHHHRHATLSWTRSVTHDDPRDGKTIELAGIDVPVISELIDDLGYSPIRRVETQRERWAWYGCGINLDNVPYLGRFVEIDGPSEATIQKVRGQLGLDTLPLVDDSDKAMLEDFLARHGIEDEYIPLAHAAHAPHAVHHP